MKDVTNSNNDTTSWRDLLKKLNINYSSGRIRLLYIPLIIILAVYYYIMLPPIHYASLDFWLFLFIIFVGVLVIELLADANKAIKQREEIVGGKKKFNLPLKYKLLIFPWPIIALIGIVSYFIFSPIFMAEDYANMIQIEQADFQEDFPETNVSQIPLVDRDTAERLGDRQLGAITDLVSQFEAANDYTQININSYPYRVTPLEYAGFFRWLNNFQEGIPHYLQVDNVSGEVELMTPPQPIKYSNAELFNRDVMRQLRFNFPFTLFVDPSFEVDDEGNPYYIASTYTRNFFIREPEVSGVIVLNAMTGEAQHYGLDNIPSWIDRVYSADLILHQITMKGHYTNGFWNSLFAKQGVTQPTAGYNYLPIEDDLYLYTGITSVVADESNIGFVLVNLRTKDATMYPLTAAEEFSAMRSAEGSVQETSYTATFPLLINIGGEPLYILTLKDNSGLIKEYALVEVQNYQNVYTAPNLNQLLQTYAATNPVDEATLSLTDMEELNGQIEDIQAVVADGNTVYYFMFDGSVYRADISLSEYLPFIQSGDEVTFKATQEGEVVEIEIAD